MVMNKYCVRSLTLIREKFRPLSFLTFLFLVLFLPGQSVRAQDAAADGSDEVLEEVVVTARRFEEGIEDAAVSVHVLTDEYMKLQGIDTVKTAVEHTPSVTYIRFNKMQPEYSMRGVVSPAEGSAHDSSVVTVIDDVVVTKEFMKNPGFFDVERVEVLRGPQGTSFGRNASAGLIHIISKRPTEAFEAGVTLGLGSHESQNVDAYISGPLSDRASGRLAVHYQSHDGYTESASTGDGIDGEENTGFRASLNLTPSDDVTLYFKAEYNEDRDDGPIRRSRDCSQLQLDTQLPGPPAMHPTFPAPFTSFEQWQDPCDVWLTEKVTSLAPGSSVFLDRDIFSLTASVFWNISDDLTLTSITGFQDGDSAYFIDAHGTPSSVLFQETSNDAQTFSEELRLDNFNSGNRLTWVAGWYFMTDEHDRDDENRFYDPVGQPTALDGRVLTLDTKVSSSNTDSFGLFAELNYDFTERLTGTIGVRYSEDDRDFSIQHTAIGWAPKAAGFVEDSEGVCVFPGPPTFDVIGCPVTIGWGSSDAPDPDRAVMADSWDDTSFKVALDFDINDDHSIYGLIASGYKTGGFQPEPFRKQDAFVPFNEETSTNFEIGYKGLLVDGRLQLDIKAFFLDYEDLQVTQFINRGGAFTALISNAGNVETTGFEFEWNWMLTDNFRITGAFAALDAEFVDTLLVDEDGNPADFSGQRPDNAPDWTATFAADYTIPLAGGASINIRGDYRGRSDVFDDVGELAVRLRPGADVFGARVGWLSADRTWEVALWGRNLNEEEQVISISPFQPDTLQLPTGYDRPLTWGVTASKTFQ